MKKFLSAVALACGAVLSHAQQVPVLIYHQVTDTLDAGQTVVSTATFRDHVLAIQQNGYTTVTISQLADYMNGKITLPEKSVAITFDDGFKNNLDAAAFLKSKEMSATFYILTDTSSLYQPERHMTNEDIKELAKNPKFEIGSHGHTHFMTWESNLDAMPDSAIVGEALMSKYILESIIGRSVTSFAWPFGYFRLPLVSFFKEIGYTSLAQVSAESKNDGGISTFTIQRINVDGRCSAEQILTILETKKIVDCQ